jgi:hypothetical protein
MASAPRNRPSIFRRKPAEADKGSISVQKAIAQKEQEEK